LNNNPVLTIVVPCYNESEVLAEAANQLSRVLASLIHDELIDTTSKILFVDDGSSDRTWAIIVEQRNENPLITGIKLSRNFGHQKALLAGLHTAKNRSDCVISIDADLQDDVDAIRDFIMKFREGVEVVYGVRENRSSDRFFKRATAQAYYRLMNKVGINLIYNHADYRLLSKRVIEKLDTFEEANMFLRGVIPLIGFKSGIVRYDRKERFAGQTKYPLKKMISFAFNGLTSFSLIPIRFVSLIGFISFMFSCIAGSYALIQKALGHTTSGWTSIIVSLWIIGGLLLMSIGLIGEYIGKIYEETKRRPAFIIETDSYNRDAGQQSSGEDYDYDQTTFR
jgi:glycosyltransferase involved in cell wall biosynthesis